MQTVMVVSDVELKVSVWPSKPSSYDILVEYLKLR